MKRYTVVATNPRMKIEKIKRDHPTMHEAKKFATFLFDQKFKDVMIVGPKGAIRKCRMSEYHMMGEKMCKTQQKLVFTRDK